jgi:hypothetical protein
MTSALNSTRALGRAIEGWFFDSADPRAYAAVRIGYAIAGFAVLIDYWPLRAAMLSSAGMFGGAEGSSVLPLNVFAWVRSETSVSIAMVVFALAYVSLGLGVLPRLSAAVAYIWVTSYSSTAAVALSGFDTILRVVGFVLVISPTVRTWSLRPSADAPAPPAYGLRLIQWQVLLIYVCTVWLKAPDPYWRNGQAVPYFLMSIFARHPTAGVAHLGALGGLLTYGTLVVEFAVPFLLWGRRTRWLGVGLGAGLHIGIALTSELALFTLAILPLYAAYFETQDFDRIAAWFGFHSRA